jgi:hypothetical protein
MLARSRIGIGVRNDLHPTRRDANNPPRQQQGENRNRSQTREPRNGVGSRFYPRNKSESDQTENTAIPIGFIAQRLRRKP